MMTPFELGILELESGNFDLAFECIKTRAHSGDPGSIKLLAEIYRYGIGTQRDESECQRLLDLLENPASH